ncbi:MAG: glycosyltransferase family 4 protein [Desulfurococcaceae archaeon]
MRVIELSTDRLPSPPLKGGAIERYVYQISRELSRLGVEVHLVSIGDYYHVEKINDVYRHVYPAEGMNYLEDIAGRMLARITSELNRKLIYVNRALLSIISEIQEDYGCIDAIHNHYFTTGFAPIIFGALARKEALLVTHYHNVPKNNLVNIMLARHYDLHLAVSRFVRNEVIRRLRVYPQKVHVVYNAIDTEEFACDESIRDRMRETYGIGKDEIVLLYVGRITPEKGLHHLAEVCKLVRRNLRDRRVILLIAGPVGQFDSSKASDAAYFHYVQKLFHKYELDVKYIGYVTHISRIYAMADLVVVPSLWQDPCPSTVLEALASCRPVVAYPVGGIPEILGELGYNFLAERIEPNNLAEKAIHVLRNLDKIDLRLLREHVEKRFSTKVVAKTLKNLIEENLQNEG